MKEFDPDAHMGRGGRHCHSDGSDSFDHWYKPEDHDQALNGAPL
jgi:hypothetical protein